MLSKEIENDNYAGAYIYLVPCGLFNKMLCYAIHCLKLGRNQHAPYVTFTETKGRIFLSVTHMRQTILHEHCQCQSDDKFN